jgi:hypothetical protein
MTTTPWFSDRIPGELSMCQHFSSSSTHFNLPYPHSTTKARVVLSGLQLALPVVIVGATHATADDAHVWK